MQRGSLKMVKNQRGVKVWRGQWREGGKGRTRILGRCCDVTRGDARAELDRIVAAVTLRPVPSPKVDTLRQFTEDEYLTHRTRYWKASTASTTEDLIERHLLSELGQYQLSALTRKDLQSLLDRKAAAGYSYSVVAHLRWQMSAIFTMAKADGLIATEPAESLIIPVDKSAVDKRVISLDQILLAQLSLEPRERLAFRLAVCEGLRPGEIVGLQIGDISNGFIHVRRRVYRGVVDSPKTVRSVRVVPATPLTWQLLESYVLLLGNPDAGAWLFASEKITKPIAHSNLYRNRIKPALELAGLGEVNFQMLRRTWVTEFSQIEDDPHVRAQIAGHSVDVHENEYRQGKLDALQRSMNKLGEHLQ